MSYEGVYDEAYRVIREEARALDDLAESLDKTAVERAASLLMISPTIVVTGMGKSGHVARKVAATMSSLGRRAIFVHPAEAAHGDLGMVGESDVILAFSWSGKTAELRPFVTLNNNIVAVTRAGSWLSENANITIGLPELVEACHNGQAPTVSTVMQLAVGDALAVAMASYARFSPDDFRRLHPGGALGNAG